ncbi:hypothetical protein BFG07_00870 [Kosakonia cowanii]|nr:hypothetical protein BFG07_00870 [Kosakonia cowanii]
MTYICGTRDKIGLLLKEGGFLSDGKSVDIINVIFARRAFLKTITSAMMNMERLHYCFIPSDAGSITRANVAGVTQMDKQKLML